MLFTRFNVLSFRLFTVALVVILAGFIAPGISLAARPFTAADEDILGIPVDGAIRIESQNLGIGHLRLHISDPKVKMEQVIANKREWTLVIIDGETRQWQPGKPLLPMVSRAIRLPNFGNVEVTVHSTEYTEYHNIDVLPQQAIELNRKRGTPANSEFAYDEKQYGTDEWYPANAVVVGSPVIIRDARTALLGYSPVQYNSMTKHYEFVLRSISKLFRPAVQVPMN